MRNLFINELFTKRGRPGRSVSRIKKRAPFVKRKKSLGRQQSGSMGGALGRANIVRGFASTRPRTLIENNKNKVPDPVPNLRDTRVKLLPKYYLALSLVPTTQNPRPIGQRIVRSTSRGRPSRLPSIVQRFRAHIELKRLNRKGAQEERSLSLVTVELTSASGYARSIHRSEFTSTFDCTPSFAS